MIYVALTISIISFLIAVFNFFMILKVGRTQSLDNFNRIFKEAFDEAVKESTEEFTKTLQK